MVQAAGASLKAPAALCHSSSLRLAVLASWRKPSVRICSSRRLGLYFHACQPLGKAGVCSATAAGDAGPSIGDMGRRSVAAV